MTIPMFFYLFALANYQRTCHICDVLLRLYLLPNRVTCQGSQGLKNGQRMDNAHCSILWNILKHLVLQLAVCHGSWWSWWSWWSRIRRNGFLALLHRTIHGLVDLPENGWWEEAQNLRRAMKNLNTPGGTETRYAWNVLRRKSIETNAWQEES